VDAQGSLATGNTAAAILAGGGGTRLGGVAKGLLQIGGRSIIETQLRLMLPLFSRVFIVTNDSDAYGNLGVPLIPDQLGAGFGPLSGVQTALSSLLENEAAVVCVAADMPFLTTSILQLLRDHPPRDRTLVPFVDGFAEPLCARYPSNALGPTTNLLKQGRLKMHDALAVLGAARLPDAAWQDFDPRGRFATNINTPEALAEAREATAHYNGL